MTKIKDNASHASYFNMQQWTIIWSARVAFYAAKKKTARGRISLQPRDYVQRIKNLAALLGRSPDTASFEDMRRYQLAPAT